MPLNRKNIYLYMYTEMCNCSLHFDDSLVCCLRSVSLVAPPFYCSDQRGYPSWSEKHASSPRCFCFQALKRAKQCASIALQDENLIETSLEFYGKVSQLLLRYVGIRPTGYVIEVLRVHAHCLSILSSEFTFSTQAPWIWRLLPDYYIDDIWDFLMSAAM